MLPLPKDIDPVIDATWPAARRIECGPFTLRKGLDGGQRVSAATADGPADVGAIEAAARAMVGLGQPPLFRVRPDEDALDQALHDAGFARRDTTNILAAPVDGLAAFDLPKVRAFLIEPPLAIMDEIWEDGGIDASRRAVMRRVGHPKTAVFGRGNGQPAGAAFAAIHREFAMIHAVHVLPHVRRQKVAHHMMVAIGLWAQDLGAKWATALCVGENLAANALYSDLGFSQVGAYHYRFRPDDPPVLPREPKR